MQPTAARGSFWVRARSGVAVFLMALAAATAGIAFGQVPIPLQEQVELFNSLPPAQQQALIREMQRSLPPAQRQAIIEMLQEGGAGDASLEGAGSETAAVEA